LKKWIGRIAAGLCVIVLLICGVVFIGFRDSLPDREGSVEVSGIKEQVSLERDRQGNATITAENRYDVAFVTGYLHGQERFFQMDLSRRLASDREKRIHRFRSRATQAYQQLPQGQRALLDQYVAGVNSGVRTLGKKPFEYWLLSAEPQEWNVEDTFLVLYSMYFTLQDSQGEFEWQNHLFNKYLPPGFEEFLLPNKTEWDGALQNEAPYVPAKIPSASILKRTGEISDNLNYDDTPMLGSNNWAVSGALTKTGSAMVANDMHLSIRVPSIWFKLRLKLNDGSLDVTGVSLPGAPLIVVGSNRSVAWGFTNSNIDTSDIIELNINPENENQYLTSTGYKNFQNIEEPIAIKGNDAEIMMVKETIWGPVMDMGDDKKYAYRWVAHLPEAANLGLMAMEDVKTVDEALLAASGIGIPAQNALIADADGNIAWTIFGKIPRRKFGNYQKVMDWSDGTAEWNEWYSSFDYPKVYNPENNRLWTANARVADGADLNRLGYSRYDLGARAKQIRDRLLALEGEISEHDLYEIMLDNEAVFLERWQKHLVVILENSSDDMFQPYLKAVQEWGGYADKNSVGFRLVREYRHKIFERLMGEITMICNQHDPNCDYGKATKQWEEPLWQLLTEQPQEWLPSRFEDWQIFFESMAFEAWQPVIIGDINLDDYVWGQSNTTAINHPLSGAVPFLGMLADMHHTPQSGDTENIPHISGQVSGQSERMVVSPGHEDTGIMNLPTGQSGHPLSPYYGASHEDWLMGNMTPFLPEQTKWTLEFNPK
jgi:penicillin G amidase